MRAAFRAWVVGGAVVTAGALALFWWLAVPRHEICGLVRPAPAGCDSDRVPLAALWSAIVLGFYVVGLFATEPRHRFVAGLGLVIGSVWGFCSVLYA